VAKPIDPQSLYETLGRWIGRARAADAAAPASAAASDLPAIEGLDASAGLRRVAGNRVLYLRLLRQFMRQETDAITRITAALDAQDLATAERIAHSLKGVAGNVGFMALHTDAATLEKAIRAGAGIDYARMAVDTRLSAALAALRSALGDDQPKAPGGEAAPAGGHMARLAALLAAGDGDAVTYLADHAASLRPLFSEAGFAELEKALAHFEFEGALQLLRHAAAARGMRLEETVS
jgi:two-component system, sensor histidine kinase and response regulator